MEKAVRAMGDMHRWTTWAAPGGAGYEAIGWVAIAAGLLVAVWAFAFVSHWWLAAPAAILAYFVGVNGVSFLWALVRRLIELREGIR